MALIHDEALFDQYKHGVQPIVTASPHHPIYVAAPYAAGNNGDNSGNPITDPFATLGEEYWNLLGVVQNTITGRLIPLSPGTTFAVAQLADVAGRSTVVQVWRVYTAPNGLYTTRPSRTQPSGEGVGGGLPIGSVVNAIADGDAARSLTIDDGPASPSLPIVRIDEGILSHTTVAGGGAARAMGPFVTADNTFPAKGASHALVSVVSRTAGSSTGVLMIVY